MRSDRCRREEHAAGVRAAVRSRSADRAAGARRSPPGRWPSRRCAICVLVLAGAGHGSANARAATSPAACSRRCNRKSSSRWSRTKSSSCCISIGRQSTSGIGAGSKDCRSRTTPPHGSTPARSSLARARDWPQAVLPGLSNQVGEKLGRRVVPGARSARSRACATKGDAARAILLRPPSRADDAAVMSVDCANSIARLKSLDAAWT